MSRLNSKSGDGRRLGAAIGFVATRLGEQGQSIASKEITGKVLALESLYAEGKTAELDRTRQAGDAMRHELKQAFESAGIDTSLMSDEQWESATMTALAYGDPKAFATAGIANESLSLTGQGLLGASDLRLKAAFEAFDDRELRDLLPFSVVFNAFSIRQSEFSETLYRTVVLSPDQAGVTVQVPRSLVFNEVKHELTGQASQWYMRNVLDAVMDPEVLATTNSLEIVPVVTGANTDAFVDAGTIAPYAVNTAGGSVNTAPLVLNSELDLLALSATPNLNGGIQDSTDALDHLIGVKNLYISIVEAGVGGNTSLIKVETQYRQGAHFLKSAEGADTQMTLSFQLNDINLTNATKDITGAAAGALSGLAANVVLRLSTNVAGTAMLQTGNVLVQASPLVIESAWDVSSGEAVAITGASLTAIKALFTSMSIIGWDPRAYRSNLNRRLRGILTDTRVQTESILVPMGSPVSMLSAVTSDKAANNIESVISTVRYRNDNNAVSQLLAYANVLKSVTTEAYSAGKVPGIFGAGRWLLKRAFYEHITLDIQAEINNLTSVDRTADVAAVIVNAAREVVYRAARETNYQAALDAYSGVVGTKPQLVFATDTNTVNHLIVNGDSRLAGVGYENYKVVASPDNRMKGKLFMTFVVPDAQGIHPLSFGNFLWMPELAATVPTSRNGTTINEATVHPRCIHINNLPILIEIDIVNLAEALTKKTAIDFNAV